MLNGSPDRSAAEVGHAGRGDGVSGKWAEEVVRRTGDRPRQRRKTVSVVHTSRLRIEKHEGPHRTAHIENFPDPVHFGIHGGIRRFYQEKYGREITGPEYPATLDHIIAGVAG
jgi:hypothetical protein